MKRKASPVSVVLFILLFVLLYFLEQRLQLFSHSINTSNSADINGIQLNDLAQSQLGVVIKSIFN